MRLTVSSFARRLLPQAPFAVDIEADALVLATRDGDLRLSRSDVRRVAGTRGWLWDTLRVEPGMAQERCCTHGSRKIRDATTRSRLVPSVKKSTGHPCDIGTAGLEPVTPRPPRVSATAPQAPTLSCSLVLRESWK